MNKNNKADKLIKNLLKEAEEKNPTYILSNNGISMIDSFVKYLKSVLVANTDLSKKFGIKSLPVYTSDIVSNLKVNLNDKERKKIDLISILMEGGIRENTIIKHDDFGPKYTKDLLEYELIEQR